MMRMLAEHACPRPQMIECLLECAPLWYRKEAGAESKKVSGRRSGDAVDDGRHGRWR